MTHTAEAGDVTTLRELENQAYFLTSAESAAQWFTDRLDDREWHPSRPDIEAARNSILNSTRAGRKLAALAASPAPRAPAAVPEEMREQLKTHNLAISNALLRLKNVDPSDAFTNTILLRELKAATEAHNAVCADYVRTLAAAPAAPPAPRAPAAVPEEDLVWLRDQVLALCEDTEERYAKIAERDLEGKPGAYARGRVVEAKSIRRAIAEVVRCRLAARTLAAAPAAPPADGWPLIELAPTNGQRILGLDDLSETSAAEVTWWDEGWRRQELVNKDGTTRDPYWQPNRWMPLSSSDAASPTKPPHQDTLSTPSDSGDSRGHQAVRLYRDLTVRPVPTQAKGGF